MQRFTRARHGKRTCARGGMQCCSTRGHLATASVLQGLDVFMAGDDVPDKKPHPSIYLIAAERMGVDPSECLVIEDSTIGVEVCGSAC